MGQADYKAVISLLEQSILATDLAIHFKTRGTYRVRAYVKLLFTRVL
jgi:hypothetical protein